MLHSNIAKKDLESEMTVVRNEYESGENSPFNILFERTLSTAYLWHNYGKSTIGARSDIENVPIERLQAFYHKYYQPDNAVLVVAGKVDEAKASCKQVAPIFGPIPKPVRSLDRGNMIYPTYTRGAHAGRRARDLAAPHRRRAGRDGALSRAGRLASGLRRRWTCSPKCSATAPGGRLYKALVETQEGIGGAGVQHSAEGAELSRRQRDDAEGSVA